MDTTPNGKDHDILVTLNVKVDRLITDMKEVKEGSTVQLADHEKRIEALEAIGTKYPASELVPSFIELRQKFHDQVLTSKERTRIVATVSSVVTFVLTTIAVIIGIISGVIKLQG
jgi:hypothetical protein